LICSQKEKKMNEEEKKEKGRRTKRGGRGQTAGQNARGKKKNTHETKGGEMD